MKNILKRIISLMIGEKKVSKLGDLKFLALNYFQDLKLFYIHSNAFRIDSFKKIEAIIILDYHSIEKGLLFNNLKPGFAEYKIKNLHQNLNKDVVKSNITSSQINVAFQIMCQYYELHQKINFDISNFFTLEQYGFYKDSLKESYSSIFAGAVEYQQDDFYKDNQQNFEIFSQSRKSIRNFTGEKIDISIIIKAVKLSLNTPSVCNRQSSKVYLLENKQLVDQVLTIQGGMSGFTKNINQLLILTTNRSSFYNVGERNQMFIDGGLFLMNLLYSLHFYKIANCPANWGKTINEEKMLEQYFKIAESEKIICIIPIGVAEDNFRVALSRRREVNEIFEIIK
ncbi:nitroreductase [Flavobacterium soyangense]|uniref:Nitroreductase n=1 Tax=Flavobacterium soyangense TaxID=2023265 RepID=A0A930XYT6_9FLAO|nr:nitroreductase [Flavobacterium soyangense]